MVDAVLDVFYIRDPIILILLLLIGPSIFVVMLITEDAPTDARSSTPPIVEERATSVGYTNWEGGYGFDYPSNWEAIEVGTLSRLESPSGRIVMTFQVGAPGTLRAVSDRLVRSLHGNATTRELIGTRWQRIGGAPSLLVSGIGEDETARRIRFLAITVRGQLHNYEITIVVPAASDPGRLLPRLEEIVSSFDILNPSLF
jgi:hypothetical protein